MLRKIDTGAGGNNGLSTPAIIDVDNDGRVDFVYAGDLLGNMWKFDLRDPDPENWGVAYGVDQDNPAGKNRIDYADVDVSDIHDDPKPLFAATGQPITSAPDVMFHCEDQGYIVVFGTGKFLGEDDRTDTSQQTVYGIWDFGGAPDQYLGDWDSTANSLSNLPDIQLLEQVEIDWRYHNPANSYLRTLSSHEPNWYQQCDDGDDNIPGTDDDCTPISNAAYLTDSIDNNGNGVEDETGENIGHAGWFFNLPYDESKDGVDNDNDNIIDEADENNLLGERVIKDVIIRDGKAIIISFIPEDSLCSGGGNSIVHEISACTGGRLDPAAFDINGDGQIDDDDYISVIIDGEPVLVAPSGKSYKGMLHTPVMVGDPDAPRNREIKIFSSSAGTTEVLWETKEETGIYYWFEH